MTSFTLKKIDDDLWRRVRIKAATEGVSIKSVLLSLLEDWTKKRPAKRA